MKCWTGSNSGRIWPVTLKLHALELWKKNCFSSFSQSPLIRYLSNLQVTRTGIKAQMSSNLGRIGLFTLELFALERWIFSRIEKMMYPSILRIRARSDQSFWSYVPLSGGKKLCSFSFRYSSNLLATRTGIKSQWSLNFSWIGLLASQFSAIECQKISS